MRKLNLNLFVLLFALLVGTGMSGQNGLWKKASPSEAESHTLQQRNSTPTSFDIFKLDVSALKNLVAQAPDRFSGQTSNVIIALPTEHGEMENFRVYEASNFEPELQAKHPGIRTYSAKGVDNPTASARFSVSDYTGVHVMITSGNHGTIYIDPYTANKEYYIAYSLENIERSNDGFQCMVDETFGAFGDTDEVLDYEPENANDGKLRTFRLALACTGEYALFHLDEQNIPPTASDAEKKAAVLSAMNDALTRVNEIYNRDVAVHMNIISNNEEIIFLDPNTDPYTNNDGFVMLNQNQSTVDSIIGNANYDIGHVFSTGGGGVAQLRSPCVTGSKARGVTGLPQPINDPFYIDYVCHEMGHQYGANHTFNNSCGANRSNPTAMEPGSGSTIMSYAGICPPNVQPRSDPYFHAISIQEMWGNLKYGSAQCGEESNTNNAPPVADAGSDYTIPKSTPFILEGSATDPDDPNGENLTYTWEQMDNQIGTMPPQSGNLQGPMFRSREPSSDSFRYMPMIQTVVNGQVQNQWEVPPSVARKMKFRMTVRDNHLNGGSSDHDNMTVTVDGDSGPFRVTSQATAETWTTGTQATITWDVAGTDGGSVNASKVDIFFSTDSGLTYPVTVATGVSNNGSATVNVPNLNTTKGRVMVKGSDNIFYHINSANITVTGEVGIDDVTFENFSVYPNPSNGVFNLKFNPESSDEIQVALYDLRGRIIKENTFNNISEATFHSQLDYSSIESGVYFLVVKNAGKKVTKKLIKN